MGSFEAHEPDIYQLSNMLPHFGFGLFTNPTFYGSTVQPNRFFLPVLTCPFSNGFSTLMKRTPNPSPHKTFTMLATSWPFNIIYSWHPITLHGITTDFHLFIMIIRKLVTTFHWLTYIIIRLPKLDIGIVNHDSCAVD